MQINNFIVSNKSPLVIIAGPCVIESEELAMETAGYLQEITKDLGINFCYKSSFEKANRTSVHSFRGLGFEKALGILEKVKKTFSIPVLTDVHEYTPLAEVAAVVDVLQTPAFLCRQTDFIKKVSSCGLPVNIKKGQFLAPWDMQHVVEKAKSVGNESIMVCERGSTFGYNSLVVDMRSLTIMKEQTACPVIFDVTHSVQSPGAGGKTGGDRSFVPGLARAGVAVGIAGVYLETHPDPDNAPSDGPNMVVMSKIKVVLEQLMAIDRVVKNWEL